MKKSTILNLVWSIINGATCTIAYGLVGILVAIVQVGLFHGYVYYIGVKE